MKVIEFLDSQGVHYEMSQHRPVFTAQQMAAEEHVPGMAVAKPVVVRADKTYYLCVLPACCKVDIDVLKNALGAADVVLADEDEIAKIFDDCTLGAEPPFGRLYGLETLMDATLEQDTFIVFQAGTHELAIRMDLDDYKKLAQPRVLNFSYHMR
ncbi:MAG TPA: YbaK/EbsC family protein [Phycisphaerales bacterium]|nr:YbaK/EbsC family protein [Phycisphaerales bacterium]